ncbi:MAG: Sulfate permease, partial [uncultured Thermomicrobiales bacterium]
GPVPMARRLARERARRSARRLGRGARPHPGGDRLLDHRRRRPEGRALRLVLDGGRHRLRRRPAGDDLGRDGRHGARDGRPRPGARPPVPLRDDDPDRSPPGRRRVPAARLAHALRLALGDDRLRQRAGDPHLPGPAPGADGRAVADLPDGRRGPGDHLRLAPAYDGGPLAPRLHRRPDGRLAPRGARPPDRRRHGPAPLVAAGLPPAGHPPEPRDAPRHPALRGDARRRRSPGVASDGVGDRRPDRYRERQEPRVRRPGGGQRRDRPPRRDGRLRDDRPVRDQREVGRARPALDLRRRALPPDPGRRARRLGRADPDGGAGRRDDHGLDRDLQLGLAPEPAHPPPDLERRHAGDRGRRRLHPQPRGRRPGRGAPERHLLRLEDRAARHRDVVRFRRRPSAHLRGERPDLLRLGGRVLPGLRLRGSAGEGPHRRRPGPPLGHLRGGGAGQGRHAVPPRGRRRRDRRDERGERHHRRQARRPRQGRVAGPRARAL